MAPKRLTKRIEDLAYAIGKPEPYPGYFKGEFVNILASVQELENSAAVRDAEAKIAVLEEELGDLKIETKELQTEVEAFRAAEREKQEDERKKDLPDKQFEILEWLPSEYSGNWRGIVEIAAAVSLAVDVTEIHLSKLKKAGFAISRFNAYDAVVWHRSETGNELVLAKQLAGEAEVKKRYKHPDLPELEDAILDVLLALRPNQTAGVTSRQVWFELNTPPTSTTASEAKTEYVLRNLKKQGFVGCEDGTYGTPDEWYLTDKANEYLAERDRL